MPLEIRGISKNDRLDAANKILEIVELQGWGNKFAHELSGGMQQRVGLARALAADPEFLLMDEPFSALDPLIRRQLQAEFIKLSKQMKKTTVFITHDLDEAVRVGHRIAIMRDGKVIQIGTPEEIVVSPADEYVADFVKGISRLKVVQAKTIMQSIENYESANGKLDENSKSVGENELLSKLIELSKSSEGTLVVKDNNQNNVGVTKLGGIHFNNRTEAQAENLRKMFLAMASDIRVVLVKLADRLHNMRTISYLGKDKQTRIAKETREIYAPLANRLGIGHFKWELEDLAFKLLDPDPYREIQEQIASKRSEREERLNNTVQLLKDRLTSAGLQSTGLTSTVIWIFTSECKRIST